MRPRKYSNIPTKVDGITFDSKKEANRYAELKLLQRGALIDNLECHPSLTITIGGVKICKVKADFAYFEKGRRVFEDTKGMQTAISRLKEKLVRACYPGIDWRIVK
jgi:hypothetical protein